MEYRRESKMLRVDVGGYFMSFTKHARDWYLSVHFSRSHYVDLVVVVPNWTSRT